MLQLNAFWKLLQFTLIKSYEQMLGKIIYLTSQFFVVVLNVNSSLYEFFWDFRKYPGAPNKLSKLFWEPVCFCFKLSRDLFANSFSLSLISTVAMALAPCPTAGRAALAAVACERLRADQDAHLLHPPPALPLLLFLWIEIDTR